MLARGVAVSHETVRQSTRKLGQDYTNALRRRRTRPGDTRHPDEVVITINGQRHYLWRAVDQDGVCLDVLVQRRRNAKAAKKFFRKLLKGLRDTPGVLATDKLGSYQVAHREAGLGRAPALEVSQQPRRELPPAHETTRASDETLPLTRPSPTVLLGARSDLLALPAGSISDVGIRAARRDDRTIRNFKRGHPRHGRSLTAPVRTHLTSGPHTPRDRPNTPNLTVPLPALWNPVLYRQDTAFPGVLYVTNARRKMCGLRS
jgi:hypothetical protein